MDDLIQEFIGETREMLEALGGEIVAWEGDPADRARLDAIFRFVHTVKGNSGFFDLPRITALAHGAEDALASVRSGEREADAALVAEVLAAIDSIGELVEAIDPAKPGEAAPSAPPSRTVRLPIELLDRMMNGVSDLVLARNELAREMSAAGAGAELAASFDRLSGCLAELRDAVTRTRMQRIESLFAGLPRLVRDLASGAGKQVDLRQAGGDVELDREMIETLRDPLTHIVRNALDHGLETPERRRAAGKPENGSLKLSARQCDNYICIEVEDDGAGIDGDALVVKAVGAGIVAAARAKRLAPAQKTALIFEPGLSTAAEVTALSGRGVGMDVVRANVERIGGRVEVDSAPGRGTRFSLRVPLTLTIIPALTVCAGTQSFAIPRASIEEIVAASAPFVRLERVAGAGVATIRGRRLPLLSLASLIGAEAGGEAMLVVLNAAAAGCYALAVDAVRDHQELVVKPAAPAVMSAGLYAGTTIGDDGQPVLLLDPAGIAAGAALAPVDQDVRPEASPGASDGEAAATWLLFRALNGARRLLPIGAVERIEEIPGTAVSVSCGHAHVPMDGVLVPLEGWVETPGDAPVRILRLTDGRVSLGYAAAEIIDILTFAPAVTPAASAGEVRGACLVGGEAAELLDLHWLFSRHSGSGATAEGPLCALPAGDPFVETILRPLIESAGYRTVPAGTAEAGRADIVILNAGETPPEAPGARLLRLRADAEPEGEKDDSIHRYDRAGLLAALAAGGRK